MFHLLIGAWKIPKVFSTPRAQRKADQCRQHSSACRQFSNMCYQGSLCLVGQRKELVSSLMVRLEFNQKAVPRPQIHHLLRSKTTIFRESQHLHHPHFVLHQCQHRLLTDCRWILQDRCGCPLLHLRRHHLYLHHRHLYHWYPLFLSYFWLNWGSTRNLQFWMSSRTHSRCLQGNHRSLHLLQARGQLCCLLQVVYCWAHLTSLVQHRPNFTRSWSFLLWRGSPKQSSSIYRLMCPDSHYHHWKNYLVAR